MIPHYQNSRSRNHPLISACQFCTQKSILAGKCEEEANLQRKLTYLWKEPGAAKPYRTAVSLHGHTNRSKEGLYFVVEYAGSRPLLRRALASQERRAQRKSAITIDFWKAYWTPPLPPLAAYRVERDQIEQKLGVRSLVSITDHDNIEAPMLLRVVPEAREVPISVEWSVPFRDTMLHLGVHNLPDGEAETLMAKLRQFTQDPQEPRLAELLEMLHRKPDVLVVLNHPLWDISGIGQPQHVHTLSAFAAEMGMFVHAFELNGTRSWEENQKVLHFAEGWNQPIIAGGDRHGSEPNAVLNLTDVESFPEFVHEIRRERRSHVLFMPQYAEPFSLRMLQAFLDVIREYPDFPNGSRTWDQRTFHPDRTGVIQPVSTLWDKPPFFINLFFAIVRLLEMDPVRRSMQLALAKPEHEMRLIGSDGQEVAS
jgi:hypothetical protein